MVLPRDQRLLNMAFLRCGRVGGNPVANFQLRISNVQLAFHVIDAEIHIQQLRNIGGECQCGEISAPDCDCIDSDRRKPAATRKDPIGVFPADGKTSIAAGIFRKFAAPVIKTR